MTNGAPRKGSFVKCCREGCHYAWTWAGKTRCYDCGARFQPKPGGPKPAMGVWSGQPATAASLDEWSVVTARRKRKRLEQQQEQEQQGVDWQHATKLIHDLGKVPGIADAHELKALGEKLLEVKKQASLARPLSAIARSLESKVSHKRKTCAAAEARAEEAEAALRQAQEALRLARSDSEDRAAELKALEGELARLHSDSPPVGCGHADALPPLPEVLKGDPDAERAHQLLLDKLLAAVVPEAAEAPAGADGDAPGDVQRPAAAPEAGEQAPPDDEEMHVDDDEFVNQLLRAADPGGGVCTADDDASAAALDDRRNKVKELVSARRSRRAAPYG